MRKKVFVKYLNGKVRVLRKGRTYYTVLKLESIIYVFEDFAKFSEHPQPAFICLKSTMKTVEQCVKSI